MARIFDAFMFRDEFDMLRMRIEECGDFNIQHVAVEARWTHRGIPKPLHLTRWLEDPGNAAWAKAHNLAVQVVDWDPDPHAPWVNEHVQRSRAWTWIEQRAASADWVLICDVDEIPRWSFLAWLEGLPDLESVVSVPMRTFLFAVDWEVAVPVPPAMVAARVKWLRRQAQSGVYLAEVRDRRGDYREYPGQGGWHFSWVGAGGPAWQAEKLDTATCHTEILDTPEADLIRSGARWASDEDGGGLPVKAATVTRKGWPRYIADRRCPPEWFRPAEFTNKSNVNSGSAS